MYSGAHSHHEHDPRPMITTRLKEGKGGECVSGPLVFDVERDRETYTLNFKEIFQRVNSNSGIFFNFFIRKDLNFDLLQLSPL